MIGTCGLNITSMDTCVKYELKFRYILRENIVMYQVFNKS